MKFVSTLLILLPLFLNGCRDSVTESPMPEVTIADLSKYKMKVLPDVPSSEADIKLVVYEECRYNKLAGVKRDGSTINIEKQYNSMIMAPCILTNDTIVIGKLPSGSYRINYKLVDIAVQPSGKTSFAVSFRLDVDK